MKELTFDRIGGTGKIYSRITVTKNRLRVLYIIQVLQMIYENPGLICWPSVTGALHNPGTSDAIVGQQCQKCGKFVVVEFPVNPNMMKCDCGGELSREASVFCPECKSKNVSYRRGFIT